MHLTYLIIVSCFSVCFAATSSYFEVGPDMLVRLKSFNVTIKNKQDKDKRHPIQYSYLEDYEVTGRKNGENATIIISSLKTKTEAPAVIHNLTVTMTYTKAKNGYWGLEEIIGTVLGNVNADSINFPDRKMISEKDLVAPHNTSFHCSTFGPIYPAFIQPDKEEKNYTISINFFEFQVQPFDLAKMKFSDSYECTGYFSPGIWMGIFTTIIMAIIMTWGIYMIMSVKTMDRFDDLKRPISIGATSD